MSVRATCCEARPSYYPHPDNRTKAPLFRVPDASADGNPVEFVLEEIRSTRLAWDWSESRGWGKVDIKHAKEADRLWILFSKHVGAPPDISEVKSERQARAALDRMENALTALLAEGEPAPGETPREPAEANPSSAPVLAGGDQPAGATAGDVALDRDDLAILRYLNERPRLLHKLEEVATGSDCSRKTAGERVNRMSDAGLIERPNGGRKGATITEAGRKRLASIGGAKVTR